MLELSARSTRRLGPDILAEPPDCRGWSRTCGASTDARVGDAAARPAARRRDRQRLEGRVALAGPSSRPGGGSATWTTRSSSACRRGGAADESVARGGARRALRLPQAREEPCPRCGTPIARAARVTTTARPTGARAARQERSRRARSRVGWPSAPPPLPFAALLLLAGSRCWPEDVGGRGRDPVRLRGARRARPCSLYEYRPLVRSYVDARAERLGALADARIAMEELGREPAAADLRRRAPGKAATPPCCGRSCCRFWPTWPRPAVGSTGATRPSTVPTPSSSAPCWASAGATPPSRRSSGSRSAPRSSWGRA